MSDAGNNWKFWIKPKTQRRAVFDPLSVCVAARDEPNPASVDVLVRFPSEGLGVNEYILILVHLDETVTFLMKSLDRLGQPALPWVACRRKRGKRCEYPSATR